VDPPCCRRVSPHEFPNPATSIPKPAKTRHSRRIGRPDPPWRRMPGAAPRGGCMRRQLWLVLRSVLSIFGKLGSEMDPLGLATPDLGSGMDPFG